MIRINRTARIAGLLYLLVAVFAGFSGYAKPSLVIPGDSAATASNIIASEGLFRLSMVSDLVAQVCHVFLALALYKLLRPVHKDHAVHMVVLALVAVPIAMLSVLNQFAALLLLGGADYLAAFPADQLHAQAMFFLELLEAGFTIDYVFWGLWLFPLGYLILKSGFLPRILGILLIIGCVGYVVDFAAYFLLPDLDVTIKEFTFIGELLLPLWLLIKGVNVEQWQKRALEPARS